MEDDNGHFVFPLGVRFRPTDEDLINYYLRKKAFGRPICPNFIPEINVFEKEPSLLPAGGRMFQRAKYFFSKNKRQAFVDERVAGSGCWRTEGKSKEIAVSGINGLVGMKNSLIFWEGRGKFQTKTNWVMHEYRLLYRKTPSSRTFLVSDWAVYRIFQTKRTSPEGSDGESSNNNDVESP